MDDSPYIFIIYGGNRFNISNKNMKQDYSKYADKELKDLLKDLNFQLVQSYTSLVEGKKKRYNTKNIKKEIARIKTEQTRRLKDNE